MKKPSTLLFTLMASLSLAGSPAWAQSPAAPAKAAEPAKVETEAAPNVKNFRALQKLNNQIVALSERAQPATVCLMSKNGRGAGSGVVVSEGGLILTAAHVTSSMSGEIVVIFPDGSRKTGVALGADYDRDAAMVQIQEPGKYPFVEVGQSKNLKRNQWTVALGHAGGFDPMRKPPVRLGRVLMNQNFVVTDTAVIGGDSGGPLFDVSGKVIGIHSNIGMTLMENRHVPIGVFHEQWETLKSGKTSGVRFNSAQKDGPAPNQPMLGIQLAEGDDGVTVGEVVPNSPAQKAGMRTGDLVKKINDKAVKSPEELVKLVKTMKAGDEVKVDFLREGEAKSTKAKLVGFQSLMDPKKAPAQKDGPKAKNGDKKSKSKKEPAATKPEAKKEKKTPKEEDGKNDIASSIDKLLKNAAKNGGRLEVTPELLEELGGMEKLMEELQKRGGQLGGSRQGGVDEFFASSLKALEPVVKKNKDTTALIKVDGKAVALGTVVSPNGRILTKNMETERGKLSVQLGDRDYEAKVLKRFPERDLALLKIDAQKLRAVRFQIEEPPLGSILTASGPKSEPLGIGLLSVSGRAMAKVGFIGIQAGESEQGVLIEKLVPGGAAADAGLKDEDVITLFDGKKVDDPLAFGHLIRGRKAGETIKVEYLRDGKSGKATVTLKERAMRDNAKNDPRMKRSLGRLSERTSGYPDAIQHDIPLPPELCGGPLFNLKGKCIGINVSRAGRTKTYAIPADEIVEMLKIKAAPKSKPKVAKKKKGKSSETLEAIKAIRASLQQIEERLNELEKAER
ncbi:MAG: serine protease Do [Akkermansiaceae bacterium]|jgi:serine protease Do